MLCPVEQERHLLAAEVSWGLQAGPPSQLNHQAGCQLGRLMPWAETRLSPLSSRYRFIVTFPSVASAVTHLKAHAAFAFFTHKLFLAPSWQGERRGSMLIRNA